MKTLKLLALFLCLTQFVIAQEGPGEPCGIYGPGTNGQVMDCDQGPVTYSSSCCNGNPGWFWTLGGNIDIFSTTPLPLNFTIGSFGSIVTGTVVSASNGQIVINWDCPETCPPSGHVIAELTACGSEWFNPTIRIGCEEDCTPSVQQCYAITCRDCIGVIVNGQAVELQGTSDNTQLFCFDLGVLGCCTFECGNPNPCITKPGGDVVARMTVNKPLETVPEVNIIALNEVEMIGVDPSLARGNSALEVALPNAGVKTQVRLVDMGGQTVLDQFIYDRSNQIQLNNLQSGTYMIQLSNADFTYTKKIVIQN